MASSILKFLWSKKWYVLVVLLALVPIIWLSVKLSQFKGENQSLINQLQETQAVYKINESLWMQHTLEVEGLLGLTKEYLTQLEDKLARGEKVGALIHAEVSLAPVIFEMNAPTIVRYIPKTKIITVPCPGGGEVRFDCQPLIDAAAKEMVLEVSIDQKKDLVHVKGWTRTNSKPSVQLDVTVDPLEVNVAITRKGDNFNTYLETKSSNITVNAAKTFIDPKIFQKQKRGYAGAHILVDAASGKNWALGAQAGYLFDRWYLGGQYTKAGTTSWQGNYLGIQIGGRF